jgi:clan AA aspartic protease
MIAGTVNAQFDMIIPFAIHDANGRRHDLEAILDTGFSGSLSLPPPVIAALGLPFESITFAMLANGSIQHFANHIVAVVWDGTVRSIRVAALDSVPLLGTHLLIGFDLRARFQVGGGVQIEAIP